MGLYVIISALVLGLLTGFGGGWKVQAWRHDAADLARQQAAQQKSKDDLSRVEHAAESFQVHKQAAEFRERVVTKEVIRVVSKPVYREQCLDDDGVRILSDDAATSNARRGLAPAVPAASAPG